MRHGNCGERWVVWCGDVGHGRKNNLRMLMRSRRKTNHPNSLPKNKDDRHDETCRSRAHCEQDEFMDYLKKGGCTPSAPMVEMTVRYRWSQNAADC